MKTRRPAGRRVPRSSGRRGWRCAAFRLLQAAIILLVAGALIILAIDTAVEHIGSRTIIPANQAAGPVDCLIVPGALVFADQTPSVMLQDRLDVALQLYQNGVSDRILVSGDHGRLDYDEVNVMRQYLLDHGVPAERVFMDHAGFDTYDTLYRARDIFGVRRAIVVTQTFHLKRALYIGSLLGLDLQGVASDVRIYPRDSYYRFREYFARSKAFLEGALLHRKPVFLGEPIPITGSGLATLG